jgi:hypothetical protein
MTARFAHPRGVLAQLLDMSPQDVPDRWIRDKVIFGLITEYYSPSLEILRELEDPQPGTIPRLGAVGTTLDKETYARRVKRRIAILEKDQQVRTKGISALLRRLFQ